MSHIDEDAAPSEEQVDAKKTEEWNRFVAQHRPPQGTIHLDDAARQMLSAALLAAIESIPELLSLSRAQIRSRLISSKVFTDEIINSEQPLVNVLIAQAVASRQSHSNDEKKHPSHVQQDATPTQTTDVDTTSSAAPQMTSEEEDAYAAQNEAIRAVAHADPNYWKYS